MFSREQGRMIEELRPGMVVVVGIPYDERSSFARGAARAPEAILRALHSGSMNLCSESLIDLESDARYIELGELAIPDPGNALALITERTQELLQSGVRVLSLGGDHSVTYPIIQAFHRVFGSLQILYIDAHPDLYDSYQGDPFSHASPCARILEEQLAKRIVQVGVRAMNPHQREQADRFGVEVLEMRDWQGTFEPGFEGPLYISLDVDGLDPAFAPGVSHPEPGGLSTRDVIALIQGVKVPVIGADIVELNPTRDPTGITAVTAAKLMKELAAKMLE